MRYKLLLVITILIIISPLFGVLLAERIGYHEPLDVAAEKLGLKEVSLYHTPFEDYTFPGLNPVAGYMLAGLLGTGIILAIGWLLSKMVKPHE